MATRPRVVDEEDDDLCDKKAREMFMKAGFNVLVNGDVDAFGRLIRALYVDHEQQQRRNDTKRTIYIALGVGLTTTLFPLLLHYFKVL